MWSNYYEVYCFFVDCCTVFITLFQISPTKPVAFLHFRQLSMNKEEILFFLLYDDFKQFVLTFFNGLIIQKLQLDSTRMWVIEKIDGLNLPTHFWRDSKCCTHGGCMLALEVVRKYPGCYYASVCRINQSTFFLILKNKRNLICIFIRNIGFRRRKKIILQNELCIIWPMENCKRCMLAFHCRENIIIHVHVRIKWR